MAFYDIEGQKSFFLWSALSLGKSLLPSYLKFFCLHMSLLCLKCIDVYIRKQHLYGERYLSPLPYEYYFDMPRVLREACKKVLQLWKHSPARKHSASPLTLGHWHYIFLLLFVIMLLCFRIMYSGKMKMRKKYSVKLNV